MAQFSDMVITNAGLDMIAASQAGGTLIFTKAKLGNGQLGEEEITELTDVISEKMEASLSSVTSSSTGHVEIEFIVDNTELDTGFFVREIGIFAKVNETGTEQLYGYANAGNYTNYLSDKSTPIDAITVKIDLIVGDASEVSFTADKSLVYVTQEQFGAGLEEHNTDDEAHANLIDKLKEAIVPYTAGTGIYISDANVIATALTAGTGISINGATISGNYKAGTGISISSGTISLASSYQGTWTISQGNNGYARESSTGFTIQWTQTSSSEGTWTFPRTFSSVYGAVGIKRESSGDFSPYTNNLTTSSLRYGFGNNGFIIAIGVS